METTRVYRDSIGCIMLIAKIAGIATSYSEISAGGHERKKLMACIDDVRLTHSFVHDTLRELRISWLGIS